MKPEHKEYILNNIDRLSVKKIAADLNFKERKIRKFLKEQRNKEKQSDFPSLPIEASTQKMHIFFSVLLIIILGFAIYGNSLYGQFIWDDKYLIEKNITITNWSNLPRIFTEDIVSGAGRRSQSYRPFQMLTYMIDFSLWKSDVRGYHLTNVLLHILVALGIYGLIITIFKDNLLSLLTGIFFVVHPIHTEAVTYVSGRADSLAFFVYGALLYLLYKKLILKRCSTVFSYALKLFFSLIIEREQFDPARIITTLPL